MNQMFFITGVNGVGKTAMMPCLKALLLGKDFDIHDFDERGVPEKADKQWRISETQHWVDEGITLLQDKKHLVICGFVKPTDFQDIPKRDGFKIIMVLLDAQPEIIRQRLMRRYSHNGNFTESTRRGKPLRFARLTEGFSPSDVHVRSLPPLSNGASPRGMKPTRHGSFSSPRQAAGYKPLKSQTVIGKPIKDFIDGNIYTLGQLRKIFEELHYPIIDTTYLTPEDVAKEVANILLRGCV